MSKKQKLEASILAFNAENKKVFLKQLDSMYKAGIKIIHYDVIDGKFAPNTAYGTEWLKELFLRGFEVNVHFMVMKPIKWFKEFIVYPFSTLAFQPEPVSKLTALILLNKIKKSNRKCGLAFKPHTDLNKYVSLIKKCDYVTIMGVEPGFGGQQFMKEITLNNLVLINKIKKEYNPKLVVQLDGGVNFEVIKLTSKYVDNFISGSFLIKQKDPKAVVKFVQQI